MGKRLEGRVAVVTGAGRGIGQSTALLMAEEGAAVVVNDLGGAVDGAGSAAAPADETVARIREAGGSAVASYESVAEDKSAARIIATAFNTFGRVDILCNAAGILRDRMVFNMAEDEWDDVLKVHLYGTFNMVRNAVPHMMRQRYGRITLFSSISALGMAGQANYSAAKEGIVGLARSLATELAPYRISVNAVYPGANTRMLVSVPDTAREFARAQQSTGTASGAGDLLAPTNLPEEAMDPVNNAAKIAYLSSEAGGAITGQVIGTNGWEMALYSKRHVIRSIHKHGRWTLDELDRLVPGSLAASLVNPAPPEPPRQG